MLPLAILGMGVWAMGVDKSADRIRRMFGEIAPRYDRMNHLLSLGIDRYWRWWTVRKVPSVGERPILDVCSGTGDLALAYYKASGGRVPIVGADFCGEMLRVAEQKKRRAGIDGQLTFLEADALRLPFDSGRFQIVAVAFGLRNVADTEGALREMVRVCATGGRVAVLEFSLPRRQPLKAVYGWYFRHLLPRIGQLLARNRQGAYNYLPQSVGQFPSGEELAERMRDTGLSEVEICPLTLGVATLYVGRKNHV